MKKVLLAGVALLLPLQAAAQVVEYYHLDGLGSVRAITSQAGAVIERHDYLPFGEEHAAGLSCPAPGQPTDCQRREFTGKERDAETGQDYFGARYYGAKTARFTTIDPALVLDESLGDPQGWNRYSYVRNNPLRLVDPDGRHPAAAAVVVAVAEAGATGYDAYDAYGTVTDANASATEKIASVGGFAAGILLPGGGYGKGSKEAVKFAAEHADDGRRLLLDTSVVISHGKEYVKRGVDAVKSFVSDIELSNLVGRGRIDMPRAAGQIPSVGAPGVHTRINVRGGLTPTKNTLGKSRGNFADGIVGASAIEQGRTLVTGDKRLAGAVRQAGGNAIRRN